MENDFTVFEDIARQVEIPEEGILSKPILSNERLRVVVFGMSKGQEISDHTSSMAAILHVVQGSADITVRDERIESAPGAWIYLDPNVPHSILAKEPLVLLLVLLKSAP